MLKISEEVFNGAKIVIVGWPSGQIFCIHGGIPNIEGSLSEIDKIPCPLRNPEMESDLAWQIMWNDPIA